MGDRATLDCACSRQSADAVLRMMAARMEQPWNAERIASLLSKARKTPNGWHACCPAHDDKNPSFFFADGQNGLALKCYAGCTYKQIAAALEARGAQLSATTDDIPTEHYNLGEYHQWWDYHDAHGCLIMRVCRWMQPGGKKDIRPIIRTIDGWKWQHHPTPRPLYQLERLAAEPDKPVIVVEGEKTAHAAQRLYPDYIATTWPGGAQSVGQADWTPIKGRALTLIPDCDTPGRKAMQWVREHVKGIAASIRIVDPGEKAKGLPEGWDLADALQENREVGDWLEQEAPQRRLKRLHEILSEPTRPQWLIRDVIEQGVLGILLGPRGTYKSFVAIHWAMTIALEGMPVVIISAEGRGIDRRFRAWLSKHAPDYPPARAPIYALEGRVDFSSDEAVAALCAELDQIEPTPVLIIIDTLSKNSGGLDENSNSEVKAFIGRIDVHLKRRYGATVLLVHHTGHVEKSRARGASALEADTDAAYVINRSPGTTEITVSRERFKDSGDLPPLAYRAEVVGLGEDDDDGRPVTSLALVPVDPATLATETRGARPRGLRQRELLGALQGLQSKASGSLIWGSMQLKQIARDLGMSRQAAAHAASALASFYLKPCIGGWKLYEPPPQKDKKASNFDAGEGCQKIPVGDFDHPANFAPSVIPP